MSLGTGALALSGLVPVRAALAEPAGLVLRIIGRTGEAMTQAPAWR